MAKKKKLKVLERKLSGKPLLKKGTVTTVVVEVEKKEPKEPKPFFKKVIQEDRRQFFFN